jgi:cell division protein FtsW
MAQRLKTDWTMFLTTVLMVCLGLVIVYSASSVTAELRFHSSSHFFVRQLAWAVASFCVLMYMKKLDYRVLKNPIFAFAPLGVVLAMLIAVYFLDAKNHRWLRVSGMSLQPSELAKPALIVFLAYFMTYRQRTINSARTILSASVVIGAVALFVVIADLGTAIVLVVACAIVFYVGGMEKRYFAVALALGAILAAGAVLTKPYRLGRVIAFVDPQYKLLDRVDPQGRVKNYIHRSSTAHDPSYQVRQSKIAVGSGGVLGVGLMQGKQKILYLPEAHTDFIYAVVGEELGLWGTTAILAGFMIIMWRGLQLVWTAPDEFGRYLALGLTAVIVVQALINISVVLGIAPTKGIPLPMISCGWSSLLSTVMSLGILLSVAEHSG